MRGYTLIELLAIIALIGVFLLIAIPSLLSFISDRQTEIDQVINETIISATELYIEKNARFYPLIKGDNYCLKIEDLINEDFLSAGLIDNSKKFQTTDILKVLVVDNKQISVLVDNNCIAISGEDYYQDDSGANHPELNDFLIPVIASESGFVKADITEKWYDYDNLWWANAVLVTEGSYEDYQGNFGVLIDEEDIIGHFVWIPRFRYQLFNVEADLIAPFEINVIFENIRSVKTNGTANDQWLTHPAFTLGETNLSGFWFGKFATTGTLLEPTILPTQLIYQDGIGELYEAIQNFNEYLNNLTARISRNTEWGAVALLTFSKYGNELPWANVNNNFLSGCAGDSSLPSPSATCHQYDSVNGLNSSSTGNIYGVYDLRGGIKEFVMAAMLELNGVIFDLGLSGFVELNEIDKKQLDAYQFGSQSTDYSRLILGDMTGESLNWDGTASFVYQENPFFLRGGDINNPGLFSFEAHPGDDNFAVRIVLTKE